MTALALRPIARQIGRQWISIAVVIAMMVAWEVAAHLSPKSPLRESPIVPPWEFIFGRALIGLADFWKIPMWAPVPQLGGQKTLFGALLAIGYHSAMTLFRLATGLAVGGVLGVVLGLALSWSARVRRLVAPSLHLVRMCPLLAMVPLFQYWFGATNLGAIVFVAYGVGVIILICTVNAVSNVPERYFESAQTMGASKLLIYRAIILPAILPEVFSGIVLTLGLGWTAVIGAEYIGVDCGLGRMLIWSENFSNTGRMALIAVLILIYATISFAICRAVQARLLRWQPKVKDIGPIG